MESLLSSLVNRLLARFVVSAGGESGSSLRATLGSTGVLVLRRLELNLDPLLGSLPVRVQRAYARELQVSISWSQQIEVRNHCIPLLRKQRSIQENGCGGCVHFCHGRYLCPYSVLRIAA